jgi:HAD superfamily hydrolase (TIGR01662 family)
MRKVKQFEGIKAIGFDVDGTLYHVPIGMKMAIGKEVIRWAAKLLKRDEDEFGEEYLARRERLGGTTHALNSYGLNGETIFQKVFDEFPADKIARVDKRLRRLIDLLRSKYTLFIISNGTRRQVERKLVDLGLDYHDFEPRICCFDNGWVKPEPAPFLSAIEALNLQPKEIVYVGDREDVDIQGAQAVGMKTIYVGGHSEIADVSIESVYDIVSVL